MSLSKPSSVIDRFPYLPLEIITLIIEEIWALPLSKKERHFFMTASLRVGRIWMLTFLRVSFTHLHIVSYAYSKYLVLLQIDPSFTSRTVTDSDGAQLTLGAYFSRCCRSLTVSVQDTLFYGFPRIFTNLSRIRHVTLLYHNVSQQMPFAYVCRFHSLFSPRTIDSLEMRFTYDIEDDDYSTRLRYLYHSKEFYYPPKFYSPSVRYGGVLQSKSLTLPYIRHLTIRGANPALVLLIKHICPALETFETDIDPVVLELGFDAANVRPPPETREEGFWGDNRYTSWDELPEWIKEMEPQNVEDEVVTEYVDVRPLTGPLPVPRKPNMWNGAINWWRLVWDRRCLGGAM
ncbi:hypothetical protein ARMGADRAFT_797462 [Armillaria gallica]|uniref:Uncharacterized protein n=1 Tax=Armillaria gallica TaxID=47427 RepID=A0A2H3E200_ARMGA|nr:hypothetical protein ARMGADRAFT_797462 [Armillaria gallica]